MLWQIRQNGYDDDTEDDDDEEDEDYASLATGDDGDGEQLKMKL